MEAYIHKVKYYECDRMGVTHHSNYVRFMEEARIDMLDRLGYGFEKMEADGIVSPVLEIRVDYRKPTTFQDEIQIEVYPISLTPLKIKFGYEMKVRDNVVCKAESLHCFIEGRRPVQLAEKYPGLYEIMQRSLS